LDELEVDSQESSIDEGIPPMPVYRHQLVEPNVRASTPHDFAKLFPSLDRLSVRHDEFTADGNLNLRVDTVVTGRRRTAIQLFHLRMHDLARREFSLRRYCRDSGREVCNSKRKYDDAASPKSPRFNDSGRPTLQRSVTTAIKTLGSRPAFRRTNSDRSIVDQRPGSRSSDDTDYFGSRPVPTNTIKLEFSNYARVDINRRGGAKGRRYEFEWWGHRYAWRRSVDKHLGGQVSWHLVRDSNTASAVAHIVPETRSPSQVTADESAGGWIPPCFMWIADESVLDAVTDVAE
jgi:hypothetical protein